MTAPTCRRLDSYSVADFARLAGTQRDYPAHEATAPACPICRAPISPLATYCSRACHQAAHRRWVRLAGHHDEPIRYSFPPPGRGD